MSDLIRPRRGSLAFRPRKRAASENVRIAWPNIADKRVLGFVGYKAGMTHMSYVDDTNSPTKGKEVVVPVSVIEVPKMFVFGIRFYDSEKSLGDIYADNDKVLKRMNIKKHPKKSDAKEFSSVRLLAFADPSKTSIGKKHVERVELGLGGSSDEQKELAESLLGKELSIADVFKPGEYLDVSAVTKGKGWQGTVKRFGTKIQRRKVTGKRRHVGTLGEWHPAYIQYTIPRPGQMGYHSRTETNKRIMFIGKESDIDKVNNAFGFPRYGLLKNEFLLIKGSVPGSVKRLVKMRVSMRSRSEVKEPSVGKIFVRK